MLKKNLLKAIISMFIVSCVLLLTNTLSWGEGTVFTLPTVSDKYAPQIIGLKIKGETVPLKAPSKVYWIGIDAIKSNFIRLDAIDNIPNAAVNWGVCNVWVSLVKTNYSNGTITGHDKWSEYYGWTKDYNSTFPTLPYGYPKANGQEAFFIMGGQFKKNVLIGEKYDVLNYNLFKAELIEGEKYSLNILIDDDANGSYGNYFKDATYNLWHEVGPYSLKFDLTPPSCEVDTSNWFPTGFSFPPTYYISRDVLKKGITVKNIKDGSGSGIDSGIDKVLIQIYDHNSNYWNGTHWQKSTTPISLKIPATYGKTTPTSRTYYILNPEKFTPQTNGNVNTYFFNVAAYDVAGNISKTHYGNFRVDDFLPKQASPYVKPGTKVTNSMTSTINTGLKNNTWYNEIVLPEYIFVDGDDTLVKGISGSGINRYEFRYTYVPSLYGSTATSTTYPLLTINYQDTKTNTNSGVAHYDKTNNHYNLKFADLFNKNPFTVVTDPVVSNLFANIKTKNFKKGSLDGIHVLQTRTFDNVGNKTPGDEFWVVNIDETSPEAFYLNEPYKNPIILFSTLWLGGATFDWTTAKDKTSGIDYYDLIIEATGTTPPLSLSTKSKPVYAGGVPPPPPTYQTKKSLPPGTYKWSVTAYDMAGNSVKAELPNSASWQYDNFTVGLEKPTPILPADGAEHVTSIMPAFSWKQTWLPPSLSLPREYTITVADKKTGTVAHSEKVSANAHFLGKQSTVVKGIKYDFEGKMTQNTKGGVDGEIKWNLTANKVFAPGEYEWWVETTDNLGNTYPATVTQKEKRTIKLLTKATAGAANPLPPSPGGKFALTFLLSSPKHNEELKSKSVTFKWGTYNSLTSYDLYIDGVKTDTLTNGATTKTLDEGTHSWYVVAKDQYNNTYQSATTNTFVVNPGGPEIEITSDGNKIKNDSTLAKEKDLKIDIKDGNTVDGTSIKVTIDGQDVTTQSTGSKASAKAVALSTKTTSLKEGTHTIKVEAKDTLGSTSTVSYSVKSYSGNLRILSTPMNYPNPFKPSTAATTLRYELSDNGNIEIQIFDIAGRQVTKQTYASGATGGTAGENEVTWDGKYHGGVVLGNGVYLYIITSSGRVLEKGEMAIYE